ncbi:penicillin-binding transpeptidase domain-containing protein [Caproicibacterium sp. NSD3]
MAKGTTSKMWKRTTTLLITLIVLGFGTVIFTLFHLQIIDGETLKSKAVAQQLKDNILSAKRGTIYDCNMKELATSADVWKIVLVPAQMDETKYPGQKEEIISGLSQILGVDRSKIEDACNNRDSYWQVVGSKVETDVKNQLADWIEADAQKKSGYLALGNCIEYENDYKRYYPFGDFASVVLGFTNADGDGVEGLESKYNSYLKGTNGRLVTAKNAQQGDMPFQYSQRVEAQDGSSLVLTIDEVAQHYLEKALEEGAVAHNAGNRALGVLMDVNTGEIKAMAVKGNFNSNDVVNVHKNMLADSGAFDPNNPRVLTDTEKARIAKLPEDQQSTATLNTLQQKWRNKAVSDTYYPGSVFKMCTGSMAMEEGVVNENTTYTCTGSYQIPGASKPINCWKTGGHGTENFVQGLCNSCNTFFIHIGVDLLGKERFFKYFQGFGFTEKTGIDLPGEANSLYYSEEALDPINLAVESFGQNFSITPLQMVTACAAVANGGNLVTPHVVKQIVGADGNIQKSVGTEVRRQVISEDTSKRMTAIMQQNATSGTAKNGYLMGYRVAGKTGTSEKVDKDNERKAIDGVEGEYYIASYCGFAPADNPQYALLIFVDEPDSSVGSYYGGAVAGPIFSQVMGEVLPYLGVDAKYDEADAAKLDVKAQDVTGKSVADAKAALQSQGLSAEVQGSGDSVLIQIPQGGQSMPKDGTVVLFTDQASRSTTVDVPDFSGMTVSEAEATAASHHLNIELAGAGETGSSGITASGQSATAGSKVTPGTIVTVTFIEKDTVM